MAANTMKVDRFDEWLKDDADAAALVMRQWLVPVEGKDAVIFPPTYAEPKGTREGEWLGYNIDTFDDGSNVCQIDSVGSQANRMEPIFKRDKYKHLVPQVVVKAGDKKVDLLDAGHRAADAIVRFSTLGPELHEAFTAFCDSGDAEPLARIAPTSIVFGSWDSRATQAKLPRLVRSVVRAFGVNVMHRSAQYSTIAGEILEDGEAEVTTEGPESELGLAHVPAVRTHGGVQVLGEIRRDASLNLEVLRALAASAGDGDTLSLRRYILGLALVSLTALQETALREGCQLVPDTDRRPEWQLVKHDGARDTVAVDHQQTLDFATVTAKAFGVAKAKQAQFNAALARDVLVLSKDARKKLLRQGPVTEEAIRQVKKKGKAKKTDKEG